MEDIAMLPVCKYGKRTPGTQVPSPGPHHHGQVMGPPQEGQAGQMDTPTTTGGKRSRQGGTLEWGPDSPAKKLCHQVESRVPKTDTQETTRVTYVEPRDQPKTKPGEGDKGEQGLEEPTVHNKSETHVDIRGKGSQHEEELYLTKTQAETKTKGSQQENKEKPNLFMKMMNEAATKHIHTPKQSKRNKKPRPHMKDQSSIKQYTVARTNPSTKGPMERGTSSNFKSKSNNITHECGVGYRGEVDSNLHEPKGIMIQKQHQDPGGQDEKTDNLVVSSDN